MFDVRPFARHDRDGLAALANRHIAAVLPGGAVPVAALLSQLERDTAEALIDPWVIDRRTIVGIEADRLVAAAHLKRYGSADQVSASYNDASEIAWLICDPRHLPVGAAVLETAMNQFREWESRVWYADGSLPCLGVYGVPDAWPHIQALLVESGFSDKCGQIEVVFAGELARVAPPGPPPLARLGLRRVVGPLGTSFEAFRGDERLGVFEVEDCYGTGNSQLARWADQANHWVTSEYRGRGIGSWLFRHGCAWLQLGGKDRLLTYAIERRGRSPEPGEAGEPGVGPCEHYYARFGLSPIGRTRRGWERQAGCALVGFALLTKESTPPPELRGPVRGVRLGRPSLAGPVLAWRCGPGRRHLGVPNLPPSKGDLCAGRAPLLTQAARRWLAPGRSRVFGGGQRRVLQAPGRGNLAGASDAVLEELPVVQRILDQMAMPAKVSNVLGDLVAGNQLGRALYAPVLESPQQPANTARFTFLDPAAAEFFPERDRVPGDIVARLRSEAGRNPYDHCLSNLVGELATRSDEFRALWAAHNVRFHRSGTKRSGHPVVGQLELSYEALPLVGDSGLTLSILTAEAGSASQHALDLLASWAATENLAGTERSSDLRPRRFW